MRYAWWIIFGLVLFLLCTQKALAYEVVGFDPTAEYVVHAVPVVVPEPASVTFSNTSDVKTSETTSKNPKVSDNNNSNAISPSEFVVTPEAGQEGVQNDSEGPVAFVASPDKSTKIDLTPLTYAGQQKHSKNFFSNFSASVTNFSHSISTSISSGFSQMGQGISFSFSAIGSAVNSAVQSTSSFVTNNIVMPTNAFLMAGKAGIQSFAQVFQAMSRSALLAASQFVNSSTETFSHAVGQYVNMISAHSASIAKAVLLVSPFALMAWSPFRKFAVTGWVSMADLVLHGACASAGLISMVRDGVSYSDGYQRSKNALKQKTGHDIGEFGGDVQIVAVRVVIVAIIFFGPEIWAAGATAATTIAAESTPELALRGNYALSKTATDCTTIPGQCDNVLGSGITFGANFVTGISPGNVGLSTSLIDEEASSIGKVITSADDEVSAVGKVIGGVDEMVTAESLPQYWHKATFDNVEDSLAYHIREHALPSDPNGVQYTKDAIEFFKENKASGTRVILKDGSEGLHFQTKGKPGGYFTLDGKIVTFWY